MPPVIDKEQCIECGACLFVCPQHVLGFDAQRRVIRPIDPRACVSCFMCEDQCPVHALKVRGYVRRGLNWLPDQASRNTGPT